MNSIFAKRRERLLATKAMRDSYVPADSPLKCPKCGQESGRKELTENLYVCPVCGHHFPVGGYHRLSMVLDPGSFRELNEKYPAGDPLNFPGYREKLAAAQRKTGMNEAAVTALGTIGVERADLLLSSLAQHAYEAAANQRQQSQKKT